MTNEHNSDSVVEPYNLVLSSSTLLNHFDMHIVMSNENIGSVL
jgi:hypothetical protein